MTVYNYETEAQKEVMKSFDAGFKGYTSYYQSVFNVETGPMRLEEKFSVRGGMTDAFVAVADSAAYNSQSPKVVGTQTIAPLIFKEQVAITKMMKVKDHYGSALEDANRLGYLAHVKMDALGATLLANAATSTYTWDGLLLINASHLVGDTGATQSNTVSGGLTQATLETALQNLMYQKDHNGTIMNLVGKKLIVTYDLAFKAMKLIGSSMTSEDANTSTNPLNTFGLQLISWPQLGPSTTCDFQAMVLCDSPIHRLEYLVDYGPTLTPDRDTATGNDLVQIDLACRAGAVDYLGTYFITT
jgi:hypothetical protein